MCSAGRKHHGKTDQCGACNIFAQSLQTHEFFLGNYEAPAKLRPCRGKMSRRSGAHVNRKEPREQIGML